MYRKAREKRTFTVREREREKIFPNVLYVPPDIADLFKFYARVKKIAPATLTPISTFWLDRKTINAAKQQQQRRRANERKKKHAGKIPEKK